MTSLSNFSTIQIAPQPRNSLLSDSSRVRESDLRYIQTFTALPPQNTLLTDKERQSTHTVVVQTALKRYQPLQPLNNQTINTNTPLVNFLANPHAKKNIVITVLSTIGASLGLALGVVNAKEKKEMKLPNEVFKTSLWMLGGAGIGYLYGQLFGASLDRNQRWTNDWILTLMGMTSPQTSIKDANQQFQQRTGKTIQNVLPDRDREEIDRVKAYDYFGSIAYV